MRTRIDLDAYATPLSALGLAKLADQGLTFLHGRLADDGRDFTAADLAELAGEFRYVARLHLALARDARPGAVRRHHLATARHALAARGLLRAAASTPDWNVLTQVRALEEAITP